MLPVAQAREGFALLGRKLGRNLSQLSEDQLRNLVAEPERRFREEALTSAAQAATIILDGVKADRWRNLVGADAHKIDEMVRRSPERAYDIAFFDKCARAAGWTERFSPENPELPSRVDRRFIFRCERWARWRWDRDALRALLSVPETYKRWRFSASCL
jgi:hypothetical protein